MIAHDRLGEGPALLLVTGATATEQMQRRSMTTAPGGTLTLLFTDIEGSARLLRQVGEPYNSVLADYRRLQRIALASPPSSPTKGRFLKRMSQIASTRNDRCQ